MKVSNQSFDEWQNEVLALASIDRKSGLRSILNCQSKKSKRKAEILKVSRDEFICESMIKKGILHWVTINHLNKPSLVGEKIYGYQILYSNSFIKIYDRLGSSLQKVEAQATVEAINDSLVKRSNKEYVLIRYK